MPPPEFYIAVVVSTLVDVAAAALVLLWRPGRVTLRRCVGAAAIAATLFVAKLFVLLPVGLSPHGVMRLMYLHGVVSLPLLGLLILLAGRLGRRPTRLVAAGAAAALLAAPIGVYASFVEPRSLRLERVDLDLEGYEGPPLRIGVLADIQTDRVGAHERRAFELLRAESPDLVLIPGDILQLGTRSFDREWAALRALLETLDAPLGVYACLGNMDLAPGRAEAFADSTMRLLVDESVVIPVGRDRIMLGGLHWYHDGPGARKTVRRMESADFDGPRVLMSHTPDAVFELRPDSPIDVVVAGHTHGGQVRVPVLGPPMHIVRASRQVAAGGLHRVEDNWVYVSRGVGHERGQAPRLRLNCPPEVTLLTVR